MQLTLGRCGNHEDALRSVRLGGALELGGRDICDLEGSRCEGVAERETAIAGRELRRSECADDAQWRLHELLGGANTLDDEQRIAVARFPAFEVSR